MLPPYCFQATSTYNLFQGSPKNSSLTGLQKVSTGSICFLATYTPRTDLIKIHQENQIATIQTGTLEIPRHIFKCKGAYVSLYLEVPAKIRGFLV